MDNNNKKPDLSFVWNILDTVLRDTFKKNEIGDVILPFVVLRRLDCMLAPVNARVREQYEKFHNKLTEDKLKPVLRKAAGGLKFYNTSRHTFATLKDDAANITINFTNYIGGFNEEVREIFTHFEFDKVIARLNRNKLLFALVQEFEGLDFSLSAMDNHDMGYVFEEILRIANEFSNETAGEHFTPRDVIRLMSAVMFTPDKNTLSEGNVIRSIYDPTCGTGGMVNLGRKFILEELCAEGNKPTVNTYGQELNEMSFAIAKSEALVTDGDADNIKLGNTLTEDQFKGKYFDYIMANPPYGVTWKKDQDTILTESQDPEGRFYAGTPRTSDGQLLFIQHMISKMKKNGTSRMAVVTSGSPLYNGGAGSGESNIRKWIIESDLLECVIALPNDLFYNTPINTYLWFLTNNKSEQRRGKVQLINATSFCTPAKKSLGNKRNDIRQQDIDEILKLYLAYEEGTYCKILPNNFFGSYQLVVEQPQRDNKGNLVLRGGKKIADSNKRIGEQVPLDTTNVHEYFKSKVVPNIDPESWIELSKTRVNYEINFPFYFYEDSSLETVDVLAEDVKDNGKDISDRILSIFDNDDSVKLRTDAKSPTLEWIDKLPQDWSEKKIKHIFSFGRGLQITKADLVDEGQPVISYGQIHAKNNTGTTVDDSLLRYVPDAITEKNESCRVFKGDFIFADTSEDKEGCGNCVYIDKDGIYAGYHSLVLHGDGSNKKYLAYLFKTDKWRKQIRSRANGVKVYSITQGIMSDCSVILPNEDEQAKIVEYLDTKTSKIDSAIKALSEQIQKLEDYKKSLISEAVTGQVDVRDWTPND